MASKKTRQNHSIQHLLELPSSREAKPLPFSKEPTQPTLPIPTTPRQVPVTVLHPTPKKCAKVRLHSVEKQGGFSIGLGNAPGED
ncbi:hypothetical protein KPH14_006288 [Odynerus spinipes]|uniref:Uncharacterized protein n=1 Tax=Odynerus spinipes TaxID=1348599 RepID=A0AAD9RS33_9HYME|nr:hypothetical protein KPH14_006288 [Odynerus spinipes]